MSETGWLLLAIGAGCLIAVFWVKREVWLRRRRRERRSRSRSG